MSDKTILIVGASRGIGLGLVEAFAKDGWRVIATVRDKAKAADLAKLGDKVRVETVDTADAKSVEALRHTLDGETLDVLVVNAGVGGPRENLKAVSNADFSDLMVTNTLAPVRLAEMFADRVKPQTGVVGLMTSQLGSVAGASQGGFDLYRASKAGLNALTRAFEAKHKDKGFAVLSLHPGWVRTDMGGPNADIDVETSTSGLKRVIERAEQDRKSGYFDYKGDTLPW